MNPDLERKIQSAREAGYNDREIEELIRIEQTMAERTQAGQSPILPDRTPDRTEELTGMAQFGLLDLAKYGLGGLGAYGAYKMAKPLVESLLPKAPTNVYGQPTTPAAPTRPLNIPPASGPVDPNQIMRDFINQQGRYAQPTPAQPTQPNWMQKAMQLAQQAGSTIKQYAPAAARVGTGVGAMLYSPGLNVGEEQQLLEIRRRAMEQEEMERQRRERSMGLRP